MNYQLTTMKWNIVLIIKIYKFSNSVRKTVSSQKQSENYILKTTGDCTRTADLGVVCQAPSKQMQSVQKRAEVWETWIWAPARSFTESWESYLVSLTSSFLCNRLLCGVVERVRYPMIKCLVQCLTRSQCLTNVTYSSLVVKWMSKTLVFFF